MVNQTFPQLPTGAAVMPSPVAGRGVLTNLSIANVGSGSNVVTIPATASFLFLQNPNGTNMGVNLVGGTASVGSPGTVTLIQGGPAAALQFDNLFIPTGVIQVCGSSGGGITIYAA